MTSRPAASRRTVLCGAALLGAAGATGLTGCGGGGGGGESEETSATPSAPVDLGAADAVPEGGARLFREQRLLVSRPTADEYKAFSAVCTHQRCVLTGVEGTDADCACHGSRFDATTGEVLQGPATAALPAVPVRVEKGRLIAGQA
ncbi:MULTISPECIES: Rieske (2Fe-2S) protein [Streptomyces]|uniref:Cytochrome bc1 complex Rieske iron-sulfur subunit n=1 Tax=Streptomyces lycii TaxID=2654337 RepID=A0ABQ7FP51_9ACTN|nr:MULTISPECIES: Rieske (2Fe-2S) protein [Streptomyces]KAF4409399.1 Rieske (2Fe-2S) protein [Streptomyces lycii]PGH46656.1 FeS-binding protein [Streptomyces sp. Ru87]